MTSKTLKGLMKCAAILLAIIGVPGFQLSGLGQIPGFPDGRPLRISPLSPTPGQPTPPSNTIPQEKGIDWKPWQSAQHFRYRTGSRLAGNWERYLEIELTSPLVSLHFTGIHYGVARANDVVLSQDNHSIQIRLVYGQAAKWSWNVTTYPSVQKNPRENPTD
jgi:hypothetical protein